ncbi:hypothetical protein [Terricaulis sp.]|uniref:hypothetical protein n=1 Tax=Terricaulis sp. TaxID=2768686 RepID=UPI003784E5CE
MRSTILVTAAAAAFLLSGCGIGAKYPTFGETSYRIEGQTAAADGSAATHTVIYRDGPKMRVETILPHYGEAIVVFDQSTNAAYVLNPRAPVVAQAAPGTAVGAQAMQVSPPGTTTTTTLPTAPATPNVTVAPATTPQVVGVAVKLDDADAPQPLESAWAALGADNASSAGRCDVAGERGTEWRPRRAPAPGVERTACITSDGIVLRVRENDRVLWQATTVQRGPQQASLFGVPAGYQLIDPAAVAEGVGERMNQLDSVTGATPAPTTAPARPGG